MIENIVGKGEITRYEHFLLSQFFFFFFFYFKRLKLQTHKNQALFWKGLTVLLESVVTPYLYCTFTFFLHCERAVFNCTHEVTKNVEILLKDEKAL